MEHFRSMAVLPPPQLFANKTLSIYFLTESRYVPIGRETCVYNFSPQNLCEPPAYAEEEMASMHYSYLNITYKTQANNTVTGNYQVTWCVNNCKKFTNKCVYKFNSFFR